MHDQIITSGSPRRGMLRTFVTFTVIAVLSYADRPRRAQVDYQFLGEQMTSQGFVETPEAFRGESI